MHHSYLKMALQMLRSNPFFSLLSIFAIAVTIMIVLIISMQHELILGAEAPEVNLNRTVIMQRATLRNGESRRTTRLSQQMGNQLRDKLSKPEAISLRATSQWNLVSPKGMVECDLVYTDWEFWNIHRFEFVNGRPFNQREVEAKAPVMVISAELARQQFQQEDPLGRTLEIFGQPFQIIGVVKDVSSLRTFAAGDFWIPLTHQLGSNHPFLGSFQVLLMAPHPDDVEAMKQEAKELISALASTLPEGQQLTIPGPDTPMEDFFRGSSNAAELGFGDTWMQILWRMMAVMLIPALNLIAINYTWIGERASEIGLRKAFGATRLTLIRQLLAENTLITAIGGILGMGLFYLIANVYTDLLFREQYGDVANFVQVQISPVVLLATLGSVLFLSIISGLLPAIRISNTQPASVLKGGAS
ncbi:MAG: ABC transporter permease [Bacteroidales bacterium]